MAIAASWQICNALFMHIYTKTISIRILPGCPICLPSAPSSSVSSIRPTLNTTCSRRASISPPNAAFRTMGPLATPFKKKSICSAGSRSIWRRHSTAEACRLILARCPDPVPSKVRSGSGLIFCSSAEYSVRPAP